MRFLNSGSGKTRFKLFSIFLFAFAIRLFFLHMYKGDIFFANPLFDAEYYLNWASSIANGDWMGNRVFFVSPLYAYFLAILQLSFHHSLYLIVLTQYLLGSVHCILVYMIAKTIFNERVGLISALIVSLYGFFLYTEGQILKSSVAYFLTTLSFYLFLLAKDDERPVLWAALGISIGMTALVIPNALIFVPIVFINLIIERSGKLNLFIRTSTLFLGLFVIIAPVTLRNYYVGRDIVLISSNGGINLFLGTDPNTEGGLKTSTIIQQAPLLEESSSASVAENSLGKHLKPSEVSSFWVSMALKNITHDLPTFSLLMLKKIYYLWNWREQTDNLDFYYFREKYPILAIPFFQFGFIVPSAFLGLWFSRRHLHKTLPIVIFIIVFSVASLPFPLFGRYRAPLVPILSILAAYGLSIVWLKITLKQWKELAISLSVFIVVFSIVNYNHGGSTFSEMHRAAAEIYVKQNNFNAARLELEEAVRIDPANAAAHNAFGYVLLQMGQIQRAISELQSAIRINPLFTEPHNTLALAYAIAGDNKASAEEYELVRKMEGQ